MPQAVGEVRYFYLRDRSSNPVALVATRVRQQAHNEGPLFMDFATSVLNPMDKSFDKERGRKIALGRLDTPRRLSGSVPIQKRTKAAIMQLLTERSYPKQVQWAAKHWLATHPEKTDATVAD